MKTLTIFILLLLLSSTIFSQSENPYFNKAIGIYLPAEWSIEYCKLTVKANGNFKKQCRFFEGPSYTCSGKWFLNQDTLCLLYKNRKWNNQDMSKYVVGDSSLTVHLILDENGMVPWCDESMINKFRFIKRKEK